MAKNKKDPITSGIGLLEIKLGACLTGPTKRMAADLHEALRSCRTIRNACARYWQRWREDNPDTEFSQGKKSLLPGEVMAVMRKQMQALAPQLGAVVVDQCINDVAEGLGAKMPYNHEGDARYRWQAVLAHEVNLQSYRPATIPLHNRTVRLCYTGIMEGSAKGPVASRLAECGKSSAVVAFQLFSRSSGRENSNIICRIEARQLTPGNRKVLKRVASGEWDLRDSNLVWKEMKKGGAWFLQLCYRQPQRPLGLDKGREAVLSLADPKSDQPFEVRFGDKIVWRLGFRGLAREYERLELRRMAMRNRYRDSGSGRKGHGRARIERDIRPQSRALHKLMERFTKSVIADVLKFLCRFDCGTLVYREPGMGLRKACWFAERNIPYDWTGLLTRLGHKLHLGDVALRVERQRKVKVG